MFYIVHVRFGMAPEPIDNYDMGPWLFLFLFLVPLKLFKLNVRLGDNDTNLHPEKKTYHALATWTHRSWPTNQLIDEPASQITNKQNEEKKSNNDTRSWQICTTDLDSNMNMNKV